MDDAGLKAVKFQEWGVFVWRGGPAEDTASTSSDSAFSATRAVTVAE